MIEIMIVEINGFLVFLTDVKFEMVYLINDYIYTKILLTCVFTIKVKKKYLPVKKYHYLLLLRLKWYSSLVYNTVSLHYRILL